MPDDGACALHLRSTPLASMILISMRKRILCPCTLRLRDKCLQRRYRRTPDANVDLNHGPYINRNCVVERIFGLEIVSVG